MNTDFSELITTILGVTPLLIAKVMVIILLILHLLFSLILLRQTSLMNRTVEAKISPVIFGLALLHFFASVGVLLWAIFFV